MQTCYDCRGLVWQGVIALFTTLIGGLVLVLLAIGFKLGLSPTIDSTLFFIQASQTSQQKLLEVF